MTWKTKTLEELCKMYQPKTLSKKQLKSQGKYLVYGANGIIGKYDKYNHEESQLLITCRGATCGSVNISEPFSWINGNAMVIQPNEKEISKKYIEYNFKGVINFSKIITGSAQPQITRESLNSVLISYPLLLEQQRIVAKLDVAFAEIDKTITVAQTSAEEAEMLFQKYLSKVFKGGDDWVDKSINDMTDKTKNVNPNKSPDAQFKYVDVSSVSNKKFEITETQLLFGKDAPSRAKKNIITNDIIFATVRPTLKRVAIIPKELNNQVASTGYVILRTNKSNHYKFLFYFLLSNIFMKAMKSLQRGASYPAVTDMDVKSQRLKVPNYQEQIKISKKLDNIMQLTNNIRKIQNKKIKELNLLKKSILRKILNTKLIKVA